MLLIWKYVLPFKGLNFIFQFLFYIKNTWIFLWDQKPKQ